MPIFRSLVFTIAVFLLGPGLASGTSTGKILAEKIPSCAVTAKFQNAVPENGKISWVFTELKKSSSPDCRSLARVFRVVIPSGSYSTLSKTNVYPLSISEPSPGAEVSLRLVHYDKIGWLIAGDADSYKVLR